MKRGIIIAIIAVIVVAVFFISDHIRRVNSSNQNPDTTQGQNSQFQDSANSQQNEDQSQENCPVVFTEYLVDPVQVQKVGQIGVVHGSGLYIVERSYISVKPEFTGKKVPIYSPVDMALRSGSHYYNPATQSTALPDYALWFDAGCGIEVNLAHLKEVVPSIANQLQEIKTDSRSTQLERIKFKAGDLIGYFIYNQGDVAGFDFIVRDQSFTNQFINQERYSGNRAGNLINGVCPYDYYEPVKKQEYYNLLGGAGGTLFEVKDCGKSSRDLAGTISGMWFLDKEPQENIYDSYKEGDYGSTLSIVGDEEAVNIGNLGQSTISRVYSSDSSYKLPTQVTGEHCYQFSSNPSSPAGYVYFKVIDAETIDVYYKSSGTCPSSMPQGSKRYYK